MEGVGWLGAIIIGGIAGWIAEKVTESRMGIFSNIILGIVGALVGMGIPEYEAKRYEGAVKGGGTLLSVHCDTSDQISLAKQGLRDTGARDISSTGEESSPKRTAA